MILIFIKQSGGRRSATTKQRNIHRRIQRNLLIEEAKTSSAKMMLKNLLLLHHTLARRALIECLDDDDDQNNLLSTWPTKMFNYQKVEAMCIFWVSVEVKASKLHHGTNENQSVSVVKMIKSSWLMWVLWSLQEQAEKAQKLQKQIRWTDIRDSRVAFATIQAEKLKSQGIKRWRMMVKVKSLKIHFPRLEGQTICRWNKEG